MSPDRGEPQRCADSVTDVDDIVVVYSGCPLSFVVQKKVDGKSAIGGCATYIIIEAKEGHPVRRIPRTKTGMAFGCPVPRAGRRFQSGDVLSFLLIEKKERKCRLAAFRISYSTINEREKDLRRRRLRRKDCGKMHGNFIAALKQIKY